MSPRYATALAVVGISLVVGRAATALNACTAADIVAQEGTGCPNNLTPCTITKAYLVGNNCDLYFGNRDVTISPAGALHINSGSVTLEAGSLTIAASLSVQIDGRGNGTPPATTTGGRISIQTTGDVNIQRNLTIRGRIDVSGNDQAGTIEIVAGGNVTNQSVV